jgi:hypothetical protein
LQFVDGSKQRCAAHRPLKPGARFVAISGVHATHVDGTMEEEELLSAVKARAGLPGEIVKERAPPTSSCRLEINATSGAGAASPTLRAAHDAAGDPDGQAGDRQIRPKTASASALREDRRSDAEPRDHHEAVQW